MDERQYYRNSDRGIRVMPLVRNHWGKALTTGAVLAALHWGIPKGRDIVEHWPTPIPTSTETPTVTPVPTITPDALSTAHAIAAVTEEARYVKVDVERRYFITGSKGQTHETSFLFPDQQAWESMREISADFSSMSLLKNDRIVDPLLFAKFGNSQIPIESGQLIIRNGFSTDPTNLTSNERILKENALSVDIYKRAKRQNAAGIVKVIFEHGYGFRYDTYVAQADPTFTFNLDGSITTPAVRQYVSVGLGSLQRLTIDSTDKTFLGIEILWLKGRR